MPLLCFGVSFPSVFLLLLASVLCCGLFCGSASLRCSCSLGCFVCPSSPASAVPLAVPLVLLAVALGVVFPPLLCLVCSVLAGGFGLCALLLSAVALALFSGFGSSSPSLVWEVKTNETQRKSLQIRKRSHILFPSFSLSAKFLFRGTPQRRKRKTLSRVSMLLCS